MTKAQYDELANDIEHKVRGLVETHPFTRNLREVALRNMAYCAGWAAVGALMPDDLNPSSGTPHGEGGGGG